MSKLSTALVAVTIATALVTGASAQTVTPRDSYRSPAEFVTTPAASPRDGQDRKDIDKDRSDANLAIERDKCGDLSGDARNRCISAARAQRDGGVPRRGTAATQVPTGSFGSPSSQSPGSTIMQPGSTPGASPSNSSTSASPSGGGTSGSAAPAAGGARR